MRGRERGATHTRARDTMVSLPFCCILLLAPAVRVMHCMPALRDALAALDHVLTHCMVDSFRAAAPS